MWRSLPALAVVMLRVSLLAQSSTPSESTPSENPVSSCVVAGRVVTAAEGSPLKSARVVLMPENSSSHHRQVYAATSDSEGHFVLKDVPSGRYQFFASHTGFVEQEYKARDHDDGAVLSLKAGEQISDVLFRMTPAAVITGRVSNEDGEAMVRVQVMALRQPIEDETEDEPPLRSRKHELQSVSGAQTDDRGQYRIFGLKPGEYYVRAEDLVEPSRYAPVGESFWVQRELGSEYASTYYPGVTQVGQAQIVPVKAGDEVQADVLMRRVKTLEVAGRVIDPSGPTAGAVVTIQPANGNDSNFDRQDTTDEKGHFRLRNIPEGSYFIIVHKRGESGLIYESRAKQRIEVNGDNIDSLVISLGGGATIQGRITLNGPTSVAWDRINLSLVPVDEDQLFGGHAAIKKDGSFEMKSVLDGSYRFSIWGLEHDTYVKSVRQGPDDVLEKGLHVEGSSSTGKLEVVLSSDGAQLEGSVSDDDGAVIGAQVRVAPDPLTAYNRFRIHRTSTDQLGHFSLTGVAPGKYRVVTKYRVSSEGGARKSEPQSVMLSENDHKTIEVKLVNPHE